MGTLGKGFILWILGVPVSLLVVLWFFGILQLVRSADVFGDNV